MSALAVPTALPEIEGEVEDGKSRNGRLTTLLGLAKLPTRTGLLQEAVGIFISVSFVIILTCLIAFQRYTQDVTRARS